MGSDGFISAGWEAAQWEFAGAHFGCLYSPVQALASSLCNVDELKITVPNPHVTEPNGDPGIVAGTPFFVFIQTVDRNGDPDRNNHALISFEANRTLDSTELGPPSQFFLSDGEYLQQVRLNRVEGTQIGTTFQFRSGPRALTVNLFLYTYFQVTASREGLTGGTTACGHTIQSNDHFVALPSTGLCNVGVVLRNGPFLVDVTTVRDVGP